MIMKPGLRKLALTAHVASSVGWLGAVAGFLALAVAGLTSPEVQMLRAAYLAMEPITRFVIVPLALGSVLTGLVQALGTQWGLLRHYWVVVKLLLTIVATLVLLKYTRTIGHMAGMAADETAPSAALRSLAGSPVLHASGALLVLLITTVLSVYKPRGMTPYGRRKHREHRPATQQ